MEPSKEAIEAALRDILVYTLGNEDERVMMQKSLEAAYAIDFGPTSDTLLTTRHIKQLEAELQTLKNDLADALDLKNGVGPTVLTALATERDRLQAENIALLAELQAAREEAAQYKGQWEMTRNANIEMTAQLAAANERIAELRGLNQLLEAENADLRHDLLA